MKPISAISSKAQLHKSFKLIPYPASNIPALEITGTVLRIDNQIALRYFVRGDEVRKILFPDTSSFPARHDDLWQATCFEFFIAIEGQPQYWEFNMSPSRDWNVYAMDAYRQVNMREEFAFTQLPFEFRKTNADVLLDISLDLNPVVQSENSLEIGVTTIIQTNDGNETYWALAHPGEQADFHLRESFILEL
ncbi:MAG TPA: DOMON-like domain-containing protein [Anaerolineales bacterium]|nr:DOMON-like domain-containing protein [Anaerolineales bacterium]